MSALEQKVRAAAKTAIDFEIGVQFRGDDRRQLHYSIYRDDKERPLPAGISQSVAFILGTNEPIAFIFDIDESEGVVFDTDVEPTWLDPLTGCPIAAPNPNPITISANRRRCTIGRPRGIPDAWAVFVPTTIKGDKPKAAAPVELAVLPPHSQDPQFVTPKFVPWDRDPRKIDIGISFSKPDLKPRYSLFVYDGVPDNIQLEPVFSIGDQSAIELNFTIEDSEVEFTPKSVAFVNPIDGSPIEGQPGGFRQSRDLDAKRCRVVWQEPNRQFGCSDEERQALLEDPQQWHVSTFFLEASVSEGQGRSRKPVAIDPTIVHTPIDPETLAPRGG